MKQVRDMTFTEGYDAGAGDFMEGVPKPRPIRSNAAPGFKGYDAGYSDARQACDHDWMQEGTIGERWYYCTRCNVRRETRP